MPALLFATSFSAALWVSIWAWSCGSTMGRSVDLQFLNMHGLVSLLVFT
jgi:hypothetical protein